LCQCRRMKVAGLMPPSSGVGTSMSIMPVIVPSL
jgi:hypothetical protein